jgi:uncharacterized membrane protein
MFHNIVVIILGLVLIDVLTAFFDTLGLQSVLTWHESLPRRA